MDSIPTTTPQQFCLRWHNHQASLLSSLPLLLDQSHLTDVTLSAEGRTVRAHRVVLSACSTYFSELFRTLEPPYHPIVVLPGTPFGALVALLTFMYSGEVNVFEEQISTLLALAETLGIKGLADFNGNLTKSSPKSDSSAASAKDSPTPTPEQIPTSPLSASALHQKILSSSLDNLFCKSFPFYSNFMNQQPLNFSRSSRNRSDNNNINSNTNSNNNHNDNSSNENRYQTPPNKKDNKNSNFNSNNNNSNSNDNNNNDEINKNKSNGNNNDSSNINNGSTINKKMKLSENMRKIDKIAENLRTGNKLNTAAAHANLNNSCFDQKFPILLPQAATSLMLKSPLHHFLSDENQSMIIPKTENLFLDTVNHGGLNILQQHANDLMTGHHDLSPSSHMQNTHHMQEKNANGGTTNNTSTSSSSTAAIGMSHTTSAQGNLLLSGAAASNNQKPSNSKLYATCFICHKQLSNQYNLRVHLETHQNVRYACTVCTHVSRSKDALRKHVSYRHPGTPSPCDSETRRKRTKTNLANQQIKQELLTLEQHNSQLQQIIQSGQAAAVAASQFNQLMSSSVPSINATGLGANMNVGLNSTSSDVQQNHATNNNQSSNNSPVPPSIKSELTANDSNENV